MGQFLCFGAKCNLLFAPRCGHRYGHHCFCSAEQLVGHTFHCGLISPITLSSESVLVAYLSSLPAVASYTVHIANPHQCPQFTVNNLGLAVQQHSGTIHTRWIILAGGLADGLANSAVSNPVRFSAWHIG